MHGCNRLWTVWLTLVLVILNGGAASCQNSDGLAPLFELLSPSQTGIGFVNTLQEKPGNNILESEFFYNGGGVAAGDLNKDGLPDLYFTANQGNNALYINRGNYRFENITAAAGVEDADGWSAGVTTVDINDDGWLDLYVCKAGKVEREQRRNKLFINQGGDRPTFVEKAGKYNLDDTDYCTQPVFFDYDRDGLLDLFIVNYNTRHFSGFNLQTIRDKYDPDAGDRLYKNNGDGSFTDVSKKAGILQNPIGFGLSATVSDLNNDGWPDIYVTNDFMERDYMYINQGDGTFADEIHRRTDVISYYSMGSDIADLNNDNLPDILAVDMLPYDYVRRRVFKTPDYDIYDQLASNGYHRANMRNTLQLNQGGGTFVEVGRLAGIASTDWSWAPLIADFDNDGHKDIFVSNGFPRFYTDLDYLNEVLWKTYPDEDLPDDPEQVYRLVQQMQQAEMHNFVFRNKGDLLFEDMSAPWGLQHYAVSEASVYVDLNNDGALDLVVSNINEVPFIYKNRAPEQNENHFLKIRLQGPRNNSFGTGARITLTAGDGSTFYREAFQTRGFQSSVTPDLHFGLGRHSRVGVKIVWPDQKEQHLSDLGANQTLTLRWQDASRPASEEIYNKQNIFSLLNNQVLGFDFRHNDLFQRDRIRTPLLPHTLSNLGPALAGGDVNEDGLVDLFVGGGQDQASVLYLQQADGTFRRSETPVFEQHRHHEDVEALFFDADGNEHLDLYVVSGGNFDPANGPLYQDRLYLNDGFGNLVHLRETLPRMEVSGGPVVPLDIEGDGDIDLFVGGRTLTGKYPRPPRSYLLRNDNGRFTDMTEQASPELLRPGMVSDAAWADLDDDAYPDLVIAGEWMPVRIFKNNGDLTFTEITRRAGLDQTNGWWNTLKVADLNGDGRPEIIAGNRGLNATLQATADAPLKVFAGDFDGNGSIDPVVTEMAGGRRYAVAGRDLLLRQMPDYKKRFPDYTSFASATVEEVLSKKKRDNALKRDAYTFASTVFWNAGNGMFLAKPLPRQAQVAPIFDIAAADFDADGIPDLLTAGNNFGTSPEEGPMAGQGMLLKGNGKEGFIPTTAHDHGFWGTGDVRKIVLIVTKRGPIVVLGRYNDALLSFGYLPPSSL